MIVNFIVILILISLIHLLTSIDFLFIFAVMLGDFFEVFPVETWYLIIFVHFVLATILLWWAVFSVCITLVALCITFKNIYNHCLFIWLFLVFIYALVFCFCYKLVSTVFFSFFKKTSFGYKRIKQVSWLASNFFRILVFDNVLIFTDSAKKSMSNQELFSIRFYPWFINNMLFYFYLKFFLKYFFRYTLLWFFLFFIVIFKFLKYILVKNFFVVYMLFYCLRIIFKKLLDLILYGYQKILWRFIYDINKKFVVFLLRLIGFGDRNFKLPAVFFRKRLPRFYWLTTITTIFIPRFF